MAPERPVKLAPPASESDSEEETSSSEEEETSPQTKPTSSAVDSKKPTLGEPESSSEYGSEDDSEAETESESDEPNVKSIASKAMDDGTAEDKKQDKSKSSSLPSPPSEPSASAAVKSGGKRVASEVESTKDARKAVKKKKGDEGGDVVEEESAKTGTESKKLFQRLWSEDDEIALLKGMVDFSSQKGADPCADMLAFHEFIKMSLHFDVSKIQLADKIRRLKKKYENNFGRTKNGKDPKFTKPHEERAFELSKNVWGGGGVSEKSVAANGKSKKEKVESRKKLDSAKAELFPPQILNSAESLFIRELTRFQQSMQVTGLDEQVIKRGLDLMEPSKRAEMEERWLNVRKREIGLVVKKAEIAIETAKAVWEAYDSSGN